MEMKLERATVAMCNNEDCNSSNLMHYIPSDLEPLQWKCLECGAAMLEPDMGIYQVDVSGVVKRMGAALKNHANLAVIRKGYNVPLVTVGELREWIDELEGKSSGLMAKSDSEGDSA